MGDEQQVGYGNPPKGSRFKKGQSGNRRGRPKGSKNLKTDLTEELQTEIKVREGPRAEPPVGIPGTRARIYCVARA